MVDTKALRAILKEQHITQAKLARKLGISQQHLLRKLKNGHFWPYEIQFLKDYLHIQDPEALFFTSFGTQHAPDERGVTLRF